MTSVGVLMKKIDDNTGLLYTNVMITGVKENYTLSEPITFSVMVNGYGSGCGDTKAILTKENDSQYKSQVWGVGRQCTSFANHTNFEFNGLSTNTTVNQAGNYTITASYDDFVTYRHTVAEQKFSVILTKIENSIKIPHVEPISTNPFMADKNGKVDLTKIPLSYNQYGQIDYEKIGHVVSENQFKKILDDMNISYAQNNLMMQDGMSILTLPPITDYCGYVKDNNTQEHWFSSSYYNDTLQNYKIYAVNPEPCKPGPPFACFCMLQTHIAENNLKKLSYFTTSEENTIGNTLSKYFDDGKVVNVSNEFVVGKYNLNIDPSMIHYCGKFTWGASLTYFEGYVKNSTVADFTLASEKQKLCAITSDAKLFSFNESTDGIRK